MANHKACVRDGTRGEGRFIEAEEEVWDSTKCGRGAADQTVVIIVFFFIFGIVIGSFLNVCIARIPEELSIVRPGSHCPKCQKPIKPYDNVPVFSWFWLRGRCRACGKPISLMYPLVELATGLLFVGCYLSFGLTPLTVKWLFFICLVIVLTMTDLQVRLLPDVVTLPGLFTGLFFSAMVPPEDGTAFLLALRLFHRMPPPAVLGLLDGVLGAAFGSFLLWGAGHVYKLVRRREGMGLGDVKMMAMAGAFLGLRNTFLTILFGTLLGSILGIAVISIVYATGYGKQLAERASRRGLGSVKGLRWLIASQYHLPMGTFLGVAAVVVVFVFSSFSVHLGPRFW